MMFYWSYTKPDEVFLLWKRLTVIHHSDFLVSDIVLSYYKS